MNAHGTARPDDRPTTINCVEFADLFQNPVVDDAASPGGTADDRRQAQMMIRKAQNLCGSCPLLKSCLYDAVIKHDVSGIVGGTTVRQRKEIRRRLGVTVAAEDLDTLAGVLAGNRPVDHDEVLRLRRANPDESLETLAHRLGCSLSTVKRHLRRARAEQTAEPRPTQSLPTPDEVLAMTAEVVSGVPSTGRRIPTAA